MLLVIVVEKLASSFIAAANSLRVLRAAGDESTKFDIAVSVYAVVATFVLLSDADCVVAVTPLVNTPELDVRPPNKVFLAAMSTPSTVPDTVIFPVTSTPEQQEIQEQ